MEVPHTPYTFSHFMQELDQVQQDLDAKGTGAPLSKDMLKKIQAILNKAYDPEHSWVAGSGNIEVQNKLYHLKDCLLTAASAEDAGAASSIEVKRVIAEIASLAKPAYLPNEMLSTIFSFLTLAEFKNLPTVSKQFAGVASADYALRQIKLLNAGACLTGVCGTSYKAIEKLLAERGHLLTNFVLQNTKISADELLHLIGLCPHLRELKLYDFANPSFVTSNRFLEKLANLETLKSLRKLDLTPINIPNLDESYNTEGLAHLLNSPKLPHLESLYLYKMDLRGLDRIPRLMQASAPLFVLKNLKSLALTNGKKDLNTIRIISQWPMLKLNMLELSHNQLSSEQVRQLAPLLPQLNTLQLYGGLAEGSLDALTDTLQAAAAKNLTKLIIDNAQETPETWQRFFISSALQNVQQLSVANCKLSDTDIVHLAASAFACHLRHCDLQSNGITDQGVKILLDSPLALQPLSVDLRTQIGHIFADKVMVETLKASPVIQKISKLINGEIVESNLALSEAQREKGLWHVII